MTRALLQAAHVWAWALAYGAVTYTYFRLNVQMRRFTRSEEEYEAFAAATANGLRWWTLGALALAAVSGAGLIVASPPATTGAPHRWWTLVGLKTAILVALIATQVYVSGWMWPQRLRAPAARWPAERRRFFRAAWLIGFLLLCQLVLGALLHAIPDAAH